MNDRLIIRRESHEEVTFAVTEYAGCEESELLERLRQAINQWAQMPVGQRAIRDAAGDFNIGDLADYTPAGPGELSTCLSACLAAVGITYLNVEVYSQEGTSPGCDFDTPLGISINHQPCSPTLFPLEE